MIEKGEKMKMTKTITAMMLVATMALGSNLTVMAAQWERNSIGWWYQEDDGTYPVNTWKWIDGVCYCFDDEGYMLEDKTTPDGYSVDANGAWIVDGMVQGQGGSAANTNDYDPNYPLKGYVEEFGLLDNIVTTRGMWNDAKESHYDSKRGYLVQYSRTYLAKTLADIPFDATGADEFDFKLTAEVKNFLNSFDWRNSSDWEKAAKCLEWVSQTPYTSERDSQYGQDVYFAYGCLVNKESVCDGFTSAYKLLANVVGLECTEYALNMHTHNCILIDGQWYTFDTTAGVAEAPYSGRYSNWLLYNMTPIDAPIIQ